jgi:hypothetical protein
MERFMRHLSTRPVALLALVTAVFATSAALAARGWMQEAEIRAELVGVKLAGIYPSTVTWSEFIAADGTSDYQEEGQRRPGQWKVAGELFCFEYQVTVQGGCFRFVKHGANCYELYTASIGGTVPAEPPSYDSMSWNGRAWRDAERSTCEDKNIS